MSSRIKEEERIERIIRGLLKLPENRRCINCNNLGPQYVCTTFWTFVCTSCSGIHREFTHRVKSVSMAKFNAEEVGALQAGGNERARQIYFKAWDPQRHSFPDSSNLHRLRDFIKHVYLDRKYTGERTVDKLSMVRVGAKEDFYEPHSIERSCSAGMGDERRYYLSDRRSPRYKQENVRSGGARTRAAKFEIVDDRFRDVDGSGSGRRSESSRYSNVDFRAGSSSPELRSKERMSPPVVRSVKEILGENVPPLRIGERPKEIEPRDGNTSTDVQKTAPSKSAGSVDKKQVEQKTASSGSLIDFSTDYKPSDPSAPQTEQAAASVSGGNSAIVQSSANEKASKNAPNVNSLEYLLFELSAPAVEPVAIPSKVTIIDGATLAPPAAPSDTTNLQLVPSNGFAPPVGNELELTSTTSYNSRFTDGQQLQSMQLNTSSISPTVNNSSTSQQTHPSVEALANQSSISFTPNAQGPSSASAERPTQDGAKSVRDVTSEVGSQAPHTEANSSGRKELPMDLFTASYSSFPATVPSWQTRPPYGVGFGPQYNPSVMPMSGFPSSAKSTNPFDLHDNTTQIQSPMFPSMSPLQGGRPVASPPPPPAGLLPSSSFGIQSVHSLPSEISMLPQSLTYEMALSPRSVTGQPLRVNVPTSRSLGNVRFESNEAALRAMEVHGSSCQEPETPKSCRSLEKRNPFE